MNPALPSRLSWQVQAQFKLRSCWILQKNTQYMLVSRQLLSLYIKHNNDPNLRLHITIATSGLETPMVVDVIATDAKNDWSYLAEGSASMVFSYVGPSHPTYNGRVLRLRKAPRQNSRQSPPYTPCDIIPAESDDPSIAFQERVMSKLIPKECLPRLQAGRVNFHWLTELASVAELRRPVERAVKDGIDLYGCKAVLATDLVGGSGWAVEIKVIMPCRIATRAETQQSRNGGFCLPRRICLHQRAISKRNIVGSVCTRTSKA